MNFWKVVLILYIIFSVLNFGMNVMVAICVKDKLRREYADYKAHNTLSFGARMCSLFRSVLVALCPIVNALFVIVLLFTFDSVVDKVLENSLDTWLELTPKDEVEG
jgi:hypothetical protein